ncbi:ABC transporter substrate-binding protein [Granulosicoccus sp. 3-233]|uniref:ABC transporter substrate-binding protein n=1 Tax=Granulosicoccus sp. 3-233 TaxID=3417969 RepID=UPI003D34C22A
MRRLFLGALLSLCVSVEAFATETLPRVISINLCADQLVMLLADPAQILALSRLSRDEAGSRLHVQAQAHPQVQPIAEDILPLAPDVIVTGPYTSRYTLSLLDELGLRVESLEIAESVDAMLNNLRRVGKVLQRESEAEQQIAVLEQRLAAVDERVQALNRMQEHSGVEAPRAAVYDANGYTVGPKSLRGEAMRRAGWHNVASDLGVESYGVLQLEDMIRLAPEALIESPYSEGTYSRGQMLAEHPALRQSGLDPLVVSLPSNETICAGPWLVDVIEHLLTAREQLLSDASS